MSAESTGATPAAGQFAFAKGMTWETLADNQLHRLKRGKHYRGDPGEAIQAAHAAAAALGRSVVVVKEPMGSLYYLWVQFNDGDIDAGDPCPRCGGTELLRLDQRYLRCTSCKALLRFANPVIDLEHIEEDDEDDMLDELLETPSEGDLEPRRPRIITRGKGDLQLSNFEDVRLTPIYRTETKDFHRGIGTDTRGNRALLLVTYMLNDRGDHIRDPETGDDVHTVRVLPLWAFEGAVDETKL